MDGGRGSSAGQAFSNGYRLLEELREVSPDALPLEELGDGLRRLAGIVSLLQVENSRWLASLDRRQEAGELGSQSTVEWMRANTRVSAAAASTRLTVARQYDELQPTLEKVEEGSISFEAAEVIARQLEDLPESVLDSAQAELLVAAASPKCEPQQLRRLGDQIRHRDDPDGWSRLSHRQFEKRRLRLFNHADGMVGIEGALPAPEGHKLRLCLESLVGTPDKGDGLSQEQRNADALVELCALQIASGKLPARGGRHPQLTVIVREGEAELEGVGPISQGTLKRLLGEDHVERRQRVDPSGVTLNFGRARRIFSAAQRQEIGTRHPRCVVGGCTVPIRDCEMHHVESWAAGGETDAKRGVPLCRRRHHPLVTEGGYLLRAGDSGVYELARAGP